MYLKQFKGKKVLIPSVICDVISFFVARSEKSEKLVKIVNFEEESLLNFWTI